MNHVGKILPVDGYRVEQRESFPTDYLQSLIHLYQPLLGIEAINLFQTLLFEKHIQSDVQVQTHHNLMNSLNLPLDKIYKARLKLEGIGLLHTYKKETDENILYTYLLLPPFSPVDFFQDIMLTELLYRHVGKTKFQLLKTTYTKKIKEHTGKNITVSFSDVFQTYQPSTPYEVSSVSKKKAAEVPIDSFNFSSIKQALQRKMIPVENVLTENNKKILSQLIQLYDLESYEIEKAILWALTEENKLDIEQLKAACQDLFSNKYNVADVRLTMKTKEIDRKKRSSPLTKEEQLIEMFETISPKQLLEDLSAGNNASEQDMKIISDIMIKQGLPTPVMNVLIHYCLLQSNMKLSKGYVEKIASHWSRANLQSAKQAIEFARKQTKQIAKPRKQYQGKKTKKEVIPDWFKDRKQQNFTEKVTLTKEQQKEQAEMIAILQKYASKNN